MFIAGAPAFVGLGAMKAPHGKDSYSQGKALPMPHTNSTHSEPFRSQISSPAQNTSNSVLLIGSRVHQGHLTGERPTHPREGKRHASREPWKL